MQADNVGAPLQFVERHLLHPVRRIASGLVFVVGNNLALKASQPLCESAAHIAAADDAHRAAFDFQSPVGLAPPQSLAHLAVGHTYLVHQGQQQTHGVLTHSVAVTFGRVQAPDADRFGIVHIDGLHPRPYASYAAQVASVVDEIAVYHNLAAHHKSVVVLHLGQQRLVGAVGPHAAAVAGGLKFFDQHRMRAVGNQNVHFLFFLK